jgi:hypothetical protein
LALHAAQARAEVIFCNQASDTVFVAIAYRQADDSWLSRGWLELAPGNCGPFDTALRLESFYYRGESDRSVWGKGKPFAIWEDDNFNYWDADRQVLNSSLAEFSAAPVTDNPDGVEIKVTFTPTGTSVTATIKP